MPWKNYPKGASDEAKKALNYKEANNPDCGTPVGWNTARILANRETLTVDRFKRVRSFLSRAKTYDTGSFEDTDGNVICGSLMYSAWGGDIMKRWVDRIWEDLPENERNNEMEKEIRTFGLDLRAMHEDESKRTVRGYAATFNSPSGDLGGFIEQIDSSAFDETDMSDVRALFNHDQNYVLGRTVSGTLRLMKDEKGLAYEVDLPDTQLGRDMYESIKRGDISQSSFAFTIEDDEFRMEDGNVYRTIKKIKRLYDVAPVTFPAYEATSVMARAKEFFNIKNKTEDNSSTDAIKQRELYLHKLNSN